MVFYRISKITEKFKFHNYWIELISIFLSKRCLIYWSEFLQSNLAVIYIDKTSQKLEYISFKDMQFD